MKKVDFNELRRSQYEGRTPNLTMIIVIAISWALLLGLFVIAINTRNGL